MIVNKPLCVTRVKLTLLVVDDSPVTFQLLPVHINKLYSFKYESDFKQTVVLVLSFIASMEQIYYKEIGLS